MSWTGLREKQYRFFVRPARPEDARGIHDVHMRSIRELCTKDYTLAEIQAWSGREYKEDTRLQHIRESLVWVVEREQVLNPDLEDVAYAYKIGAIERGISGFGQLFLPGEEPLPGGKRVAWLQALYFGAEVAGRGFGKKMVQEMFQECEKAQVDEIRLDATLTAHSFYQKMGFHDAGPMHTLMINGVPIRGFPMVKVLER